MRTVAILGPYLWILLHNARYIKSISLDQIVLDIQKMVLHSEQFDIFDGPNSDHEITKPLNTKGKGGAQTIHLRSAKMKRKGRPQRVVEPTKSVRLGRKRKQYTAKTRELRSGELDKPRRSARLEQQNLRVHV